MKFPKIDSRSMHKLRVGLGLAMLVTMAAAPVMARDPMPAESAPAEDERLESIVIVGGATDPQNERWVEPAAKKPLLPIVRDDAFLEAESIEAPEATGKR